MEGGASATATAGRSCRGFNPSITDHPPVNTHTRQFKRGTPLAGPVHVDKKGLTPPLADLYGLFKAVAKDKGSFEAVRFVCVLCI